MTVCDAVTLDAGNPGSNYVWNTGETSQTISVTTSGTYSVTITDSASGCEVTDEVTVTVNYTPEASFTYSFDGLTVNFVNTSTSDASYSWDFGDGDTSNLDNPSHTYDASDTYTVTLSVSNSCGSTLFEEMINVGVNIAELTLYNAISVYPNPTSDKVIVKIKLNTAETISLKLVNPHGQIVWSDMPAPIATAFFEIDMTGFADGIYQLNIISDGKSASKQIVLTK
jgi:PKD repeat protein